MTNPVQFFGPPCIIVSAYVKWAKWESLKKQTNAEENGIINNNDKKKKNLLAYECTTDQKLADGAVQAPGRHVCTHQVAELSCVK